MAVYVDLQHRTYAFGDECGQMEISELASILRELRIREQIEREPENLIRELGATIVRLSGCRRSVQKLREMSNDDAWKAIRRNMSS